MWPGKDGVPPFRIGPSGDHLVAIDVRPSLISCSNQGHLLRGRHSLGEIHGSSVSILTDFVEEQIVGGFHSAIWKSTFSPSFFGSDNSRPLIIRLLQREFTFASGRRIGHYQSQIIMIQSGNEVLKAGFSPFQGQTLLAHLIPAM